MVPKYRLKLYTNVDALKVGAWVKTDMCERPHTEKSIHTCMDIT